MSEPIPGISATQLQARLNEAPPPVIVDVRPAGEYVAGHVPGAVSVPLDELTPARIGQVVGAPDAGITRPLHLTCQTGVRARQAAERLAAAGLNDLVLLQGGTAAWERAGLPLRRLGRGISLERQVQITIGAVLILKVIFGFTVHEAFFAVGLLIGIGLIVTGTSRCCGLARLLARLPWNRTAAQGGGRAAA